LPPPASASQAFDLKRRQDELRRAQQQPPSDDGRKADRKGP
jgi:hypothetical protein